ncbi:MAG: hypothetical protein ACYTHJ_00215 [Planctomycetota bacterium]|jgi:hypothetical protein
MDASANTADGNGRIRKNTRGGKPRGPIGLLLDLFSSLWLGITLLILLFVYCSIGSAVPKFRQHALIEMTEFEWFHWWPFDLLVGLFALNMFVITVRRIPFRFVNWGVWSIHFGIIIMTLGSYLYFGTKIEGDAPVFRRQVVIEVPGAASVETLVAVPGSEKIVTGSDGRWKFGIGTTNTEAEVITADQQKAKDFEVMVRVSPPTGEPYVRYVYANHPEYARDLIPGSGFAINAIGKRLVNPDLGLSLDLAPSTRFHVKDTWALYVRRPGEENWSERRIKGLPRYNDYIASRDQVYVDDSYSLPIRPIDVNVPPGPQPDALGDTSIRITGYLRYATISQNWREGGNWLNPVLNFTASVSGGEAQSFELVALDPQKNATPGGGAEFRWLDDKSKLDELPASALGKLEITVAETGKTVAVSVSGASVVGRDGPWTELEGSSMKYRIVGVPDRLTIGNKLVSLAMVEVETPDGRFTRMVADDPSLTRDMHGKGEHIDPHGRESLEPDSRLTMTFSPAGSRFIFAGYPGGLTFIHNGADRRLITKDTRPGEVIPLEKGAFRVNSLLTHAVREAKPYVVPESQRNRDMNVSMSMIRLEVGSGNGVETKWVPYNHYAFPDAQYRYSGRFRYQPKRFQLADGSQVEVLFSRERRPLPAAVALRSFDLDEHVGGYTGSASTIRNYVSRLTFFDGSSWTDPVEISVNNPTGYGGFWYYQANWDPPSRERPGSGMNFTGLGVGNRNGVYTQLAGSTLAVMGMVFAFYVKPAVMRRRAAQSRARAQSKGSRDTGAEPPARDAASQAAGV